MIELARTKPNATTTFEHLPNLTECGPMDVAKIRVLRQKDVYFHAPQRRGIECRDNPCVGQEVRRDDAYRAPRCI
jgi:hypothetical protein